MTLAPALRALFVSLMLLAELGSAARADERIGVIAAALETPRAAAAARVNATFEFERCRRRSRKRH
jgi:hypothetical protein